MTIVGTAEIVVDANTAQVGSQLQSGVNAPLQKTGTVAEAQAGRAKRAWGSAASSIGNAFSNELGGMQSQFQGFTKLVSQHGKIVGGLLGGGTGALAAGVIGASLGSSEQAALQQLQVAVTNTGASWETYGKRVEDAVGHGANLAFKSTDVLNALLTLTVGLKSPQKALDNLDFTMNIARKQHIDLATAAGIAMRANLGLARGLLPLGVNLSADNKIVSAATTANKAHAAAVTQLADKKRALRQEEERVGAAAQTSAASQASAAASIAASIKSAEAAVATAKFSHGYASPQAAAAEARLAAARARTVSASGPSVSQEIALANARKAVADAQQKVADTADAMRQANHGAAAAQNQINNATDQARHNVDGLAQAHVHTFGGQFDVWKTKIEDQAAILGHKYGPALIATGFGLQGLAGIYSTTAALISRFRGTQEEQIATTEASTAAVEAQGAAVGTTATEITASATTAQAEWLSATDAIDTELASMAAAGLVDMDEIATASETAAAQAQVSWLAATARIEGGLTAMSAAGVAAMGETGLAGSITGAESEVTRAMPMMAASTEMGMGRMSGAIAGVVGVIGSFGIGASMHGTGGAVAGSLGGAITGAIAGLSVGGPFGAAVGAAGGLLVGLAGHFLGAGHGASTAAKDIAAFTNSLNNAYAADKGKLGAQSRGAINQFLQSPSAQAAGLPGLLDQAGITMKQIITGIRDPASLKTAAIQASRAQVNGKITAAEFTTISDALQSMDDQFQVMVTTADSIASINGQVTQHMNDIASSLQAMLREPTVPHPTTGATTHRGDLGGLLSGAMRQPSTPAHPLYPPMAAPHRAGGGEVMPGVDYQVGEHGPEVVRFSEPAVVYQHGVAPRGGDGASTGSFDQATHMYLLRLVSAAERQLHATESLPPQIASRIGRGHREFHSPELASIG